MRFVPHNNVVALAVAPSVWLAYFVATFMVTEIGCTRAWMDVSIAGLNLLDVLLWSIAAIGLVLISYASWQSWRNLRAAQDPDADHEPEVRDRREFIARSGFFLCGISLLGTLWGALTILVFDTCGT